MKLKFIALLLVILLAACTNTTPVPVTPTPPVDATPTLPADPTPTLTPTPPPGKVILFSPDPASALAAGLRPGLADLASTSQLALAEKPSIQPADLAPEVRIVVLLSAPDNLNDLLAAAPKTQFVLLSASAPDPKSNLSVIRQDPNRVAFVAGFVATVISEDWRSAALLPDSPASLPEAFKNGGGYFCGRCTPIHGPIVLFPVTAALPAGSGLDAWQTALTGLKANLLETLYVDPTIATPDLLKLLGEQTFVLVGGASPSDEALKQRWAATVSSDALPALRALWPGLLAGTGGQSLAAGVSIGDVNPDFLTPGKQRLAQDVIDRLAAGTLDPLTPAAQ